MSPDADLSPIDELRGLAPAVAVLCDVDGTLAPIVGRAADAAITPRAREALYALSRHYALVACVSGRRALDARRIVGLDELHYIGNHGFEELEPGAAEPRPNVALGADGGAVGEFTASLQLAPLMELGIEVEDKGPIQAFHWRGSDQPAEAEAGLRDLGSRASRAGLVEHWGRRILELRPPIAVDKGTAIEALIGDGIEGAFYAGDDTTDLDAFAALRRMQGEGRLERSVCVGVGSDEGPEEIASEADLTVGFDGVVEVLERLGEI